MVGTCTLILTISRCPAPANSAPVTPSDQSNISSLQSNDSLNHHKNGTPDGYSFSDENYKAGNCGSGHTLTGDIPQGDVRYDTARANMGTPWKMFTQTQGQELIDNTTSVWTTINGVNGRKFINKSDSTKYVFLAAGGYWTDTTYSFPSSRGYYWSNICVSSYDACYLYFISSEARMSDGNRYRGRSIRGIQ